ncbi:BapA/Bap/LapF family large adhesin [Luteimonas sp. 9C]|uniref:BapA/Bap/LapF family large adhesin n=1 Tax=Luteimonas sp. 9C TaxID=2653148 RepID=UPI001916C803|nr:BapA/Bap/LapF family large adhesin [Luteimonas sp. 9C]
MSGTAEIGATVNVFDAGGAIIGTGVAGTDGRYTITLDPALTAGEQLTVTATDAAGNESAPISLTAPDLTDNEAPDAPTAVINATGDTVSGTAEIGATVNVFDAGGAIIGTGVAGTDGRYTITLDPALTAGEQLTVTATDAAGNESAPISLTAPDLTDNIAPEPPIAAVTPGGDAVVGTAEAGATVNVFDADGNLVGTGVAGTNGRFTVPLAPPLVAGEVLMVTATDAAGNESGPTSVTAPDFGNEDVPASPIAAVSANGDAVSGSAEAGATVTVYDADGNVLGSVEADSNGDYAIPLDPPLIAGEQLSVTASNAVGESFPTTIFAPDLADVEAPAAPTAVINGTGDTVTGQAEIGATVEVRDPDGNLLGSGVAGTGGFYTITLDPPLTAGEQLSVTAVDAAGNVSDPTLLTAPDLTDVEAPAAPTAAINDTGDIVSGHAEIGATVEVRDLNGTLLGSGVAGTGGFYTITLDPPLTAGEQLSVTAVDAAGNVSDPTLLTAPDLTDVEAPAAPTAAINDTGDTVSGQAEIGATVEVRDIDGTLLGSGVAGTGGFYTITLDPPLTAGEQLSVTAVDAAGNVSDPTLLTAPDLTDVEAPAAPTAAINDTGDTVSGQAEIGSTVEVRDLDGNLLGSGIAGTGGFYTITLDPPLTAGEQLSVTAVDAAGNVSDPTLLTAPDLDVEAPDAPTAMINAAGDTVSGQAEENSTVTVRDADGTVLGTAVAGPDGGYAIVLDPPLTGGERLSVTATDPAGNVSDPTLINAPNVSDNIIAYDDIASANLDIVPATQNVALGSAAYLLLVSLSGLNLQATVLGTESVSFSVGQGRELDAVFDYSALLTAGVLGNYQVVVQRWDGTQWTGVDGNDQATLLELNLLTGNAQAEAPDLGPGEYRAFMTFNGVGVGLLGALSVGGIESDFTIIADVVGDAISGNVVTDGGGDVVTSTTVVQSVNGQVVDGTVEIVGQYGVLQIDASGAYTYVPNEAVANIGQVDQFVYTLFDPVTGNTSSATLFVRIDSSDVDLTWDDANPGAPATFDFGAIGDAGAAGVEFANVTGDLYDDSANLALTLINPSRTYVSQTFSVSDSMEVSGTASINLLVALASNGSLVLQQQTTTGAWVNVGDVVTYNLLLGVVGTAAEIDLAALDLGAGTYRFRATVGGVVGLNANVSIDVNATYLDQFEVAGVDAATGNVLANDMPGSGFTQLQVFDNAAGGYVDVPAGTTVSIQGQYGALNVDAGGSYVYTPDGNSSFFGAPVSESFEYRLLHPTGQVAQGELVVTVEPGGAGVNSVVESFDLETMAIEDAQVDSDAGNDAVSGEFDASALFGAMAYEAPILVRGEGGEVIALDVPQVGGLHHAPMWEAEYGVPLRQEDETDTLLAQQTTSAL